MSGGEPLAAPVAGAWVAAALALLSVAVSILSALLQRSGPIRLRHWAEEAGGRLQALYAAVRPFEVFRALLSWFGKLSQVALALATVAVLLPRGWIVASAGSFGLVAVVVAATELASRALVSRDPERALRMLTAVYRAALLLLAPLVYPLARFVPAARRRAEGEPGDEASEGEIEAFIGVGTAEGILEPGEENLLWGVVDFADTLVRSVMTPRIDMVCAPVESDLDALVQRFLDSKHSRIPLYQDSIDHVVGILHILDLLGGLRSPQPPSARDLVSPPHFVPETKRLDELLREFQAHHRRMAIVVDEYGGTAGLVTVEDLLEEIVGDIPAEHDERRPAKQALPDGSWRFDGRTHVEELAETFAVHLDGVPYETIGGLIFSALGYVPREGESVSAHGLRFIAEQVTGRRVRSVVVRRETEGAAGG